MIRHYDEDPRSDEQKKADQAVYDQIEMCGC